VNDYGSIETLVAATTAATVSDVARSRAAEVGGGPHGRPTLASAAPPARLY